MQLKKFNETTISSLRINLSIYVYSAEHASNGRSLTRVTSLDAAAADICKEGCLMEDEQSKALAKVPTDLLTTRN